MLEMFGMKTVKIILINCLVVSSEFKICESEKSLNPLNLMNRVIYQILDSINNKIEMRFIKTVGFKVPKVSLWQDLSLPKLYLKEDTKLHLGVQSPCCLCSNSIGI